jgi:acyl dehydratase
LTAESPTSAATRFTALVPIGEILFATFQCTVTDATGGVGTIEVTATLTDGSWGSFY